MSFEKIVSENTRQEFLEKLIGREIKAVRNHRQMTLADLAAASGVSLSMLSKIENGAISPSLKTLDRLSQALGVAMSALFIPYDEESRTPDN
jgi:transcriptional regulator with XRE-family HTH domain